MAETVPFSGLVDFFVQAIQTALARSLQGQKDKELVLLQLLKPAMIEGNGAVVERILETVAQSSNTPPELKRLLLQDVLRLADLTPALLEDEVSSQVLSDSSSAAYRVGCDLQEMQCADMAYNLFESAYHLSAVSEKPCFEVATKLFELSNPENVDQHHSAIWRFAIERLTQSIDIGDEWLEALDAVELALNVYVSNPQLQQQLCDTFVRAMRRAEGTPIEELVAIYPVQVPAKFISSELRRKAVEALAGTDLEPNSQRSKRAATELWAAIKAQNMLDDVRLMLSVRYTGGASLTWHDLTLTHSHLVHAVPLQMSLTVDVDRTGDFVLQLSHEIAHAYCLLGPIGWAVQACRVAVHFWESIFGSLVEQPSLGAMPSKARKVMHDLPSHAAVQELAEIQLASSYRSAVIEAVWIPWLEGVAQYVELLADPTDDPNEIISVHEAVRSLVDYQGNPRSGESEEEFVERYAAESTAHFENFLKTAQSRLSSARHLGYMLDGELSEVYVLGYLMVRSVVARWEKTLGQKIAPIFASKLLLDVTRNGTHEIEWCFADEVDGFQDNVLLQFLHWLERVADLDRESIESFLESVDPDTQGHKYFWSSGRPLRVDDNISLAESTLTASFEGLENACVQMVSGRGVIQSDSTLHEMVSSMAGEQSEQLHGMFASYVEFMSLVPVGKDMARLVLLEEDGRVIVCPRTYVGLEGSSAIEAMPRYSVRSFNLQGGVDEADMVRRYCGEVKSSRLLVTRILDLIGNVDSPTQRANSSYVCMFLGEKWERVGLGDGIVPLGPEHSRFVEKLRERVLNSIYFENEEQTIRSPKFLATRLLSVAPDSILAKKIETFEKYAVAQMVALKGASKAFYVSDERGFSDALSATLSEPRARIQLADILCDSGIDGEGTAQSAEIDQRLFSAVFETNGFPRVRPFGGTS